MPDRQRATFDLRVDGVAGDVRDARGVSRREEDRAVASGRLCAHAPKDHGPVLLVRTACPFGARLARFGSASGPAWIRTRDRRIMSPLL
jgi:hypothetical protein